MTTTEVRCDDWDALVAADESGQAFTVNHICDNGIGHAIRMDINRDESDRDIQQLTWENAIANGETWPTDTEGDTA